MAPAGPQVADLARLLRDGRLRFRPPARLAFQMEQLRERREHDAVAEFAKTQAQIEIVEGDGEMRLVQPADLVEHAAPDGETGARHRQHAARHGDLAVMARLGPSGEAQHMRRRDAGAEQDAGMLQRAVRVQQFRPDRADIGAQRVADQFAQPCRVDHLDIVVEQHDDFAARLRHRRVVDGGEVERAGMAQHAHARIGRQVTQRLGRHVLGTVVIDDQHL